jgi:hypothetical protein
VEIIEAELEVGAGEAAMAIGATSANAEARKVFFMRESLRVAIV